MYGHQTICEQSKFKSVPGHSCTKNWIAKYFVEHRISALMRLS